MAELGTVTVLFCDLVGSTELAGRVGDDAADRLRRECFTTWRSAVERTGGEEVKTAGDGMMVAFTSIVAALDCAVAMQQGTHDDVALKVGLSTGEATKEDDDYFGTPVVEAARLCDACAPGQILANAVIQMLAGSRSEHTFTSMGELELKGLDPLPTVEVSWEPSDETTVPFPPMLTQARRLGFVGRRDQRTQLEAWFNEAAARRVVLIAGEPGVGKTRLAAEFASWAHGKGAIVLAGRCDEGMGAPFQPWMHAVEHLIEALPGDTIETLAGDGLSHLGSLAPSLGVERPTGLDPETQRLMLFQAVDGLLARTSERNALILVLDDLHWADQSSLQLLRHVAASPHGGAVFVVATYRDTDVDRRHPLSAILADLRRQGTVERMSLRGLAVDEVAELIQERAGHAPPREFVEAVAAQTEGNPFFTDEVLQHLARTGAIVHDGSQWIPNVPLDDLGIPEGIRDVVGRRLSQLSESTNEVLTVAAVVGPQFDLDIVTSAAEFDAATALAGAEEASDAVLLTEVDGAVGRFAFTHALVRQTLLEELSTTRRVQLHWAIGEAQEAKGQDADVIAYHLSEGVLAGDTARAVAANVEAGELAARRVAPDEAIGHFQRAHAVLDQARWPDDELRMNVLIGLADAHMIGWDRQAGSEPLFRAVEIARALDDTDAIVRAAMIPTGFAAGNTAANQAAQSLGDQVTGLLDEALDLTRGQQTADRAQLLSVRCIAVSIFDPPAAVPLAEEAWEMAQVLGDPETLYHAAFARLQITFPQPNRENRQAFVDEWGSIVASAFTAGTRLRDTYRAKVVHAMASGDRTAADALMREWDASVKTGRDQNQALWAGCLIGEGRFVEAEADIKESRERWRGPDGQVDPLHAISVGELRGLVMAFSDDAGRVAANIRPLVESGLIPSTWWARYAVYQAAAGDHEAALDAAARVDQRFLGPATYRSLLTSFLSEVAAVCDSSEVAALILEPAREWTGQFIQPSQPWPQCAGDVAIGQCLMALGRAREAIGSFESGIELEERMGFRAFATRSRYFFAKCLKLAGQEDHAREARDRCVSDATELGMQLYVRLCGELNLD